MKAEQALIKIIRDYKQILKRHMSAQDSSIKFQQLGIKRNDLRHANSQMLMSKVNAILEDLNSLLEEKNRSISYCGLTRFAQHIRKHIKDHKLTDQAQLIHTNKKASKSVVHAIQLMSMGPLEPNLGKLQNHIQTALKYGSSDQNKLLIKALKQHSTRHADVIVPLIHLAERTLQQRACAAS